jgi:hypothetical protein
MFLAEYFATCFKMNPTNLGILMPEFSLATLQGSSMKPQEIKE